MSTQLTPTQINAVKLAAWLYGAHPKLFGKLLTNAKAAKVAKSKTKGISGLGAAAGCGCSNVKGLGRLGSGGVSAVNFSPIDTSSFSSPDLSSIGASSVSSALSSDTSSGGFWSSLGSGLSSLGSDVLSGIGSTASYLTSGSGLSNLTSLANTYFASQSNVAQANAQQAIVNAQVQRTATGYSPAPVSYQTNAAGQLVPVYNSASGYSPLTTQGIAALSTGAAMPSWLLPAGIGAAALIAVFALMK